MKYPIDEYPPDELKTLALKDYKKFYELFIPYLIDNHRSILPNKTDRQSVINECLGKFKVIANQPERFASIRNPKTYISEMVKNAYLKEDKKQKKYVLKEDYFARMKDDSAEKQYYEDIREAYNLQIKQTPEPCRTVLNDKFKKGISPNIISKRFGISRYKINQCIDNFINVVRRYI